MSLRPLRFLFGATCPVSHTPVADNVAVSSKRRFRLLLQLNADFLRKRAQGDHFDILTKGSLLRPPNSTKSKNHREYFSGSFPLAISALSLIHI